MCCFVSAQKRMIYKGGVVLNVCSLEPFAAAEDFRSFAVLGLGLRLPKWSRLAAWSTRAALELRLVHAVTTRWFDGNNFSS